VCPSKLNCTLPVGVLPGSSAATVAVSVVLCPTETAAGEAATVVVVPSCTMLTFAVPPLPTKSPRSGQYVAEIVEIPTPRRSMLDEAWPSASSGSLTGSEGLPSTPNRTQPVGTDAGLPEPTTEAVNVTSPGGAGSRDGATVVWVAACRRAGG
jgi:hypothetical protein